MKSKRGSHVGVILSFVIFITFLIFLYSLLQPSIKLKEDKENVLKNLKLNLKQRFSAELEAITFVINQTTTDNCVSLEDFVSRLLSENFVVKNESGGLIVNVRDYQNDLLIERDSLNDTFFKIYDSEVFADVGEGNISGCEIVTSDNYIFKSANIEEEVFLSLINKTKTAYESNYSLLKEELGVPLGGNFAFSFTDKKTILIKTSEENVSTSVYAEEIPVLFVDSEANLNPGFLTIKVW